MNRIKRTYRFIIIIALMMTAIFCISLTAHAAALNKKKATVPAEKTLKLTLNGTSGRTAWSTSDKNIATVDQTGTVRGVNAGKAKITARAGNKNYTCIVTVTGWISESELSLRTGATAKLKLHGTKIKKAGSDNKTVAKVTKKGKVTALSAGNAKITLTGADNKKYICKVTVTNADENVEESHSFEEFAKMAAELISRYPVDMSEGLAAEDEFISKRLIVKCNFSDISFSKYSPIAMIKSADNIFVLQFASSSVARVAYELIKMIPGVEYVEPDIFVEMTEAEGMEAEDISSQSLSWGTSVIGADKYAAYVSGKTSSSIKVAVVDTGVSSHSFLGNRITSDGYDYVRGGNNPQDYNGHGTHVAGTIVDCTPGLKVNIMPVRVLDAFGYGSTLNVANGIRYAVNHGAKVINLSLGGGHSQTLDNAVDYAVKNGVIVVAAAGNDNDDTKYTCPAHNKNIIVVGAVNSGKNRADFSNYGDALDVVAPGVDIRSTVPGGRYETWSGTSMATPHIAAAAAMLKLVYTSYSPTQIEQLIKNNSRDLGSSGWDRYYGYGLPDLGRLTSTEVTGVYLNKTNITIGMGKTYTLTATVQPSNAKDKSVSWSSSANTIATVLDGTVIGIRPGTATITVRTSNGKTASCVVKVSNPVAGEFTIRPKKNRIAPYVIGVGEKLELTSDQVNSLLLRWKSSNPAVASVSLTGTVTGKKAGTTTITATNLSGAKSSLTIRVSRATAVLDETGYTAKSGNKMQLTGTVYLDRPVQSGSHTYVLNVACQNGGIMELGAFNIDGPVPFETRGGQDVQVAQVNISGNMARFTLIVNTERMGQIADGMFIVSVYPYDKFAAGNSISDSLAGLSVK
ncbi:MAG: S8 family serine peptidase [Blautia sp.]|nr:S8 family serine peptidase [Blautia sp.]